METRKRVRFWGGLAAAGLAVLAAPSFAGCGGATNSYSAFADAGPSSNAPDSTTQGTSSGSNSSSGGSPGEDSSGACNVACSTDNDCINSCPAPSSGGANCCDPTSNTCYLASSSTCPSVPDSSLVE